jgi:hypothetical protein
MEKKKQKKLSIDDLSIEFLAGKQVANAETLYNALNQKKKALVHRLLCGDKKRFDITFQEEWRKFSDRNPAYATSTNENFVLKFWDKYDHIPNLLVLRCQNEALCYMLAPATVQHYMVAIATNGHNTDMLDLGKYSSSILAGMGLVNFIMEEEGGNTELFMRNICCLYEKSDIVEIEMTDPTDPAERQLLDEMMGTLIEELQINPVLVSCIKINDDFNHNDSLRGRPKSKEYGCHALVLIGM